MLKIFSLNLFELVFCEWWSLWKKYWLVSLIFICNFIIDNEKSIITNEVWKLKSAVTLFFLIHSKMLKLLISFSSSLLPSNFLFLSLPLFFPQINQHRFFIITWAKLVSVFTKIIDKITVETVLGPYETRYSRLDQVKFKEDSL